MDFKGTEPRRGVGRRVVGKDELRQRIQPESGLVLHHVFCYLALHQLDHFFGCPVSWGVKRAGPSVVHAIPVAQGVNVLGKLVSSIRLEDAGRTLVQPEGFESFGDLAGLGCSFAPNGQGPGKLGKDVQDDDDGLYSIVGMAVKVESVAGMVA